MSAARAAICLAALFLAGCGAPEVEGDPELTVYLSAPLSGPVAGDGQDIADGAQLALDDAEGEAAGIAVRLEVLDDATDAGWDAALTGANARIATQDSTAVAYLGELDSGATRTSLPITNEAGLLQVSAGSGAEDLVAEAIGSEQIPPRTQPSGVRTFGRVTPSDVVQGEAAGVWMGEMGIESVEVIDSDDPYGAALLSGLESAATGPQIATAGPSRGEADASYVALADLEATTESIIPRGTGPLLGSDALIDPGDRTALRAFPELCRTRTNCPSAPRDVLLTSAALDPSQLPPAADGFLAAFDELFTIRRRSPALPPGRYAAYGYEAMALILDSIERAEDPLNRADVIDAFFATTDRESILGTYSIDEVGDTTLEGVGAYRVVDGRARPEPEPLTVP